jgi:hypothetical protein
MLISDYDRFVQKSDQSASRPVEERIDIAIYGLAAEVGSVVAAIKKRLLAEGGQESWNIDLWLRQFGYRSSPLNERKFPGIGGASRPQ